MPASVMKMPEARKAVQMYQEGFSQPQIAQAVGRSRKAVRTALAQLGVKPRTPTEGYLAWLEQRKSPHPGEQLI